MLKGHLANGAKISLVFFCKISKNIGIPSLKRRQKSRFKRLEEDWL